MRSFADVEELRAAVGHLLGPSEWLTIDQKRVDGFADATDDHQWIHVDPDAAADGPFGTTIVHGYLVLSLAQKLAWDTYSVGGVRIAMNTGSNKVRYLAPVPVGSRIRTSSEVVEVSDVTGGVQALVRYMGMVARYLGWRLAGALEWKELAEFLLARAMEHDSPTLLFRLACEHLMILMSDRGAIIAADDRCTPPPDSPTARHQSYRKHLDGSLRELRYVDGEYHYLRSLSRRAIVVCGGAASLSTIYAETRATSHTKLTSAPPDRKSGRARSLPVERCLPIEEKPRCLRLSFSSR